MQWYYATGGQRHGPVTKELLKGLATSGQLAPSDLVWRKGMGQWVAASTISGLFASSPLADAWYYGKGG